jgi:hypothetical protein
MSISSDIDISHLESKLRQTRTKVQRDWRTRIVVGYTAPYAIYVHENLQANHPTGQAKFLEKALRRTDRRLATIIANSIKAGATFQQAALKAGEVMKEASQELVPVDTGFLRNSAFNKVERTLME